MLTDEEWAEFKGVVDAFSLSVNRDELIWKSPVFEKSRYGESKPLSYTTTTLNCLIQYNFFRTWPLSKHTEAGEIDQQNMVAQFNRQYLSDQGHLTTHGYLNFDPAKDLFIHDGILYKGEADTQISQAGGDSLHIWIVLLRQNTATGTDIHEQA